MSCSGCPGRGCCYDGMGRLQRSHSNHGTGEKSDEAPHPLPPLFGVTFTVKAGVVTPIADQKCSAAIRKSVQ